MSVTVDGLHVAYTDGVDVVRDLSFSVATGEVFVLLGPSGSGKTTALRTIAGFERARAGSIKIAGDTVARPGDHRAPEKRQVGYVFQEYALFPHLTVAENIAFGLRRWTRPDRAARVTELAKLVDLSELLERRPSDLSGGQQQRVALARAVAPRPAVLLLDEPFSNLDTALRRTVRDRLTAFFRTQSTTVVLVTHDQDEALTLADKIGVMCDGVLHQVDAPETLYDQPVDRFVAEFIGRANVVTATDNGGSVLGVLGELPGEYVVRPHALSVEMGGAGTVEDRVYHGHEALLTVSLSGHRLTARVAAAHSARVGDSVSLRLTGKAWRLGA